MASCTASRSSRTEHTEGTRKETHGLGPGQPRRKTRVGARCDVTSWWSSTDGDTEVEEGGRRERLCWRARALRACMRRRLDERESDGGASSSSAKGAQRFSLGEKGPRGASRGASREEPRCTCVQSPGEATAGSSGVDWTPGPPVGDGTPGSPGVGGDGEAPCSDSGTRQLEKRTGRVE